MIQSKLCICFLFHSGNCLELAANGILNHAKCQNFTWGCPDKAFLSDKIYNCKYDVFLSFIKPINNFLSLIILF